MIQPARRRRTVWADEKAALAVRRTGDGTMRVRGKLLDLLLDIVREDQLDWSALVHVLGISQPRASNLLHRHMEKFNSETLIDMLARVGVRVEVRPVSRDRYRRFNIPPRRR